MKDVLITIKGTQGIDNDSETVELTTLGKFGLKDGMKMISYEESEIIGAKGIKTFLRVKDDNTVILQRKGPVESRLTIQEGVRNTCFYGTQFGNMTIGIFGETVKCDLSPEGGTVKMSYTIDTNLQLVSRNTVEISVKEVEKECQKL